MEVFLSLQHDLKSLAARGRHLIKNLLCKISKVRLLSQQLENEVTHKLQSKRTLVVAEDFFNIVRFERFGCQEYTYN